MAGGLFTCTPPLWNCSSLLQDVAIAGERSGAVEQKRPFPTGLMKAARGALREAQVDKPAS
jgi:hypothetical protein